MNDDDLRDSLRVLGPLLPIVRSCGVIVDGQRRERLAREVGRPVRTLELSPEDATRALWLLHPERAVERAGKLGVEDYARAFGVRVLEVASYLNAQRRALPTITFEKVGTASRLVGQWWPPRLHYAANVAARARGMNLSAFVREAVAVHVARVLDVDARELAKSQLKFGANKDHPRKQRSSFGTEYRPSRKAR